MTEDEIAERDDLMVQILNLRALVKRLHKELRGVAVTKSYNKNEFEDLRQNSIDLEIKLGIERYEV
jgi:hypothetical protein